MIALINLPPFIFIKKITPRADKNPIPASDTPDAPKPI